MKSPSKASKRALVLHTGMRTIKWWVCYKPLQRAGVVLGSYRTKKRALAAQRYGEAVVQVKGHYFPADIRKPRGRAPTVGDERGS